MKIHGTVPGRAFLSISIAFLITISAMAAESGDVSGTWTGTYTTFVPGGPDLDITVEIARTGGRYRASISSASEGWTIADAKADHEDGVLDVHGVLSVRDDDGDIINVGMALRGDVDGNSGTGTFTVTAADEELETDFSLTRRGAPAPGKAPRQRKTPEPKTAQPKTSPKTATPKPAAPTGDVPPELRGERAVWLRDPVMGPAFAVVVVPEGWMADGRVIWDFPNRVNPYSTFLVYTNPTQNKSVGFATRLGAFTWSEKKGTVFGVRDGTFMTDTGIFNLRYRNAEAVLREFVAPAVQKAIPGARIVSISSLPQSSAADAQARAQEMARLSRGGKQVTGIEATAAEMVVEYTGAGGVQRDTIATTVAAIATPELDGTVEWEWVSLLVVSAPKGQEVSEREIAAVLKEKQINPAWERERDTTLQALRQAGMEISREAQIKASEFMRTTVERQSLSAEKFRREVIRQEKLYVDPKTGEEIEVPATKYALRDSITNRVLLSDTYINPNTLDGNYVELRSRD